MKIPAFFAGLPVVACLVGCAAIDNSMKSPVGAVSTFVAVSDDNSTEDMPLRAIDDQGHIVPKKKLGSFKQPLYYAYDVSRISTLDFTALAAKNGYTGATGTQQYRDELLERILYRSDQNFLIYDRRALALDRGTSFTQKVLDSLTTASIGGVALASGPGAAIIGGGKLVVDSTQANAKAVYLGNQSMDAILGAMGAARQKAKTAILVGLYGASIDKTNPTSYVKYSILDALTDVGTLEQAGTIFGALDYINQTTASTNKAAQELQTAIKSGAPASDTATKAQAVLQ